MSNWLMQQELPGLFTPALLCHMPGTQSQGQQGEAFLAWLCHIQSFIH